MIAGGGAPEIEIALKLADYAQSVTGVEAYCFRYFTYYKSYHFFGVDFLSHIRFFAFRAYAQAMEVIPSTLAENAGLNPIQTVTELRNRHAQGEATTGINVRKGAITNILEENVVQPLLVSTSIITLASETVRSILKIDDIVSIAASRYAEFNIH